MRELGELRMQAPTRGEIAPLRPFMGAKHESASTTVTYW
jgi:hypothetical protein